MKKYLTDSFKHEYEHKQNNVSATLFVHLLFAVLVHRGRNLFVDRVLERKRDHRQSQVKETGLSAKAFQVSQRFV